MVESARGVEGQMDLNRHRLFGLVAMSILSVAVMRGQGVSGSIDHHLGYSLGFVQEKEENLLLKVHSGVTHWLVYSLEMRGDAYHRVDLQVGYGSLATSIQNDVGSTNGHLAGSYSYSVALRESGPLAFYFGPRVAYSSSLTEYQTWDEAHAYWGTCLSLGLSGASFIDLQTGKLLALNVDLSLLSLVSRPGARRLYANERWTFSNITTIMNSGFHVEDWTNALQVGASAEYRGPVAGIGVLSFSPSFFYSRLKVNDGNPLKEIIIRMSVGIWL